MFDLLIFTQYSNAYGPQRFSEESQKAGLRVKVISYDDVSEVSILPASKMIILREPNFVSNFYDLRDKIIDYYMKMDSAILNSKTFKKWPVIDKFVQHQEFEKGGIPHIKLLKLEEARYPYIVKARQGSHGSHVFKIEKKSDLDQVFEKGYELKDLLIQEFQTSGSDLRVIVLSDKVLGVMQRIPKAGSFLSNYSQGGSVKKYEGDDIQVVKDIAIKTAKHFQLEYVGVDLMMGNDGSWKVLEINRACQFKGFEMATGVNVAREVLDFLESKKSVV